MANEITIITDFELKEDLLESILKNNDIIIGADLKKEVNGKALGTLLEVEKQIGSSVTILSVKEVNEKLLKSAFN